MHYSARNIPSTVVLQACTAVLVPLANARHIKSGPRYWLLRIRGQKPQKGSIIKPLGSLSGKLLKQGSSIPKVLARDLTTTRQEIIDFGRSQRRHLATLASLLPPLRKGNDMLVHTAIEKGDVLGVLFATNSSLNDQATTPPTILRSQSSMPEVKFGHP